MIEIQRSVKASLRAFIDSPEPLVRNLVLSMSLWVIVNMNYQINAYYSNFYPGDSYSNLIFISIVELFSYIFADIIFEKLG